MGALNESPTIGGLEWRRRFLETPTWSRNLSFKAFQPRTSAKTANPFSFGLVPDRFG